MLLTVVVQWCHIVAAILWVGGAAMLDLVVMPLIERAAPETARSLGRSLTKAVTVFFASTGSATILFGILRGTLFGPIKSLPALLTPYGITWCVALLLSGCLALIGALGIGRAAAGLYPVDAPPPEHVPAAGEEGARLRRRLRLFSRVQLVGFGIILVCMVLMGEVFS